MITEKRILAVFKSGYKETYPIHGYKKYDEREVGRMFTIYNDEEWERDFMSPKDELASFHVVEVDADSSYGHSSL